MEEKNRIKTIVSKAPARTCLFGDHQDYLQLPIISCAIDRYISLRAVVNGLDHIVIDKPDIGKNRTIHLDENLDKIEKGDHLMSALKVLRKYACIPTQGYDVVISGNIAINAGTSSSSAVVISWIRFLLEAYGCNVPVTKELVSQIAYEAEVVEQGASGGRMDQYSIGLGNILYLETEGEPVFEIFKKPLKGLIVAESGIPKQTTAVLKELKENAFLAINRINEKLPEFEIQKAVKKDLPNLLNYLPQDLQPYLIAAIANHSITQKALLEFRKKTLNTQAIGALMNEHHTVLKERLKLTVPKIDAMIDGALEAGALGAKIVGSGRGGSIVVLAREGDEPKVIEALMRSGARDAYKVNVDRGARIEQSK